MSYTKAEWTVLPIMLLLMLVITAALWFGLRNASRKVRDIPFLVITLLLCAGEVAKQIIGILEGYDTWYVPLHFCSTYFIWFALAEFSRGKFRKRMQNVAFVATIYLFVGFYIAPRGIIGGACENIFEDFFTAHTFFFHHLVLLYGMLGVAFKRFDPDETDARLWMGCFSIYFVTALTFAYEFDTNYFNLLYSIIPPLESFRLAAGQVVYTLFLGAVVVFGGAIFIRVFLRIKEKWFADDPIEEAEEAKNGI